MTNVFHIHMYRIHTNHIHTDMTHTKYVSYTYVYGKNTKLLVANKVEVGLFSSITAPYKENDILIYFGKKLSRWSQTQWICPLRLPHPITKLKYIYIHIYSKNELSYWNIYIYIYITKTNWVIECKHSELVLFDYRILPKNEIFIYICVQPKWTESLNTNTVELSSSITASY